MHTLISSNQSAFILGRLITYNIMIVHELLHTMKRQTKGKKGKVAIKLDISKAYNRVEWKYLDSAMQALGFNAKWRKLIMDCITTVNYLVLVNGQPSTTFRPTWGLRQGDLLSPYFFLICAKGHNVFINSTD